MQQLCRPDHKVDRVRPGQFRRGGGRRRPIFAEEAAISLRASARPPTRKGLAVLAILGWYYPFIQVGRVGEGGGETDVK